MALGRQCAAPTLVQIDDALGLTDARGVMLHLALSPRSHVSLHAMGVIVGRALQRSWHREREAGAGEGDTGERVRRRVASMGEWDRRMIYR